MLKQYRYTTIAFSVLTLGLTLGLSTTESKAATTQKQPSKISTSVLQKATGNLSEHTVPAISKTDFGVTPLAYAPVSTPESVTTTDTGDAKTAETLPVDANKPAETLPVDANKTVGGPSLGLNTLAKPNPSTLISANKSVARTTLHDTMNDVMIGATIPDPYLQQVLLLTYNKYAGTSLTNLDTVSAEDFYSVTANIGYNGPAMNPGSVTSIANVSYLVTPDGGSTLDAGKVTTWEGFATLPIGQVNVNFASKEELALYLSTNSSVMSEGNENRGTLMANLDYESDGTEDLSQLGIGNNGIIINYLKNKDTVNVMSVAGGTNFQGSAITNLGIITDATTINLPGDYKSAEGILILAPNLSNTLYFSDTDFPELQSFIEASDYIHASFTNPDKMHEVYTIAKTGTNPDLYSGMTNLAKITYKVDKDADIEQVVMPEIPSTVSSHVVSLTLEHISVASYNKLNMADFPDLDYISVTGHNITEPKDLDMNDKIGRSDYFDTQVEYGLTSGANYSFNGSAQYYRSTILNTTRQGKTDSWYIEPATKDLIIPLTSITRGISPDNFKAKAYIPTVELNEDGAGASFEALGFLRRDNYTVDYANGLIRVPRATLLDAIASKRDPDVRISYVINGDYSSPSAMTNKPVISGYTDFTGVDLAYYAGVPSGSISFGKAPVDFGTHTAEAGTYAVTFTGLTVDANANRKDNEIRLSATPFIKAATATTTEQTLKADLYLDKSLLTQAGADYKGNLDIGSPDTVKIPATTETSAGVLLATYKTDQGASEILGGALKDSPISLKVTEAPKAGGTYNSTITATLQPKVDAE